MGLLSLTVRSSATTPIKSTALCALNQLLLPKHITKRFAVDLAYKIYGKQPTEAGKAPIIVLHGLLGLKRNWGTVSNSLASECQRSVVAVDLRNHGDSPHSNTHTYPELASDVNQLISKLSLSKAAVLGHSMGGRTAMVLALTEPSKVDSLVAVDISPISTPGILNDFFPRLIDAMQTVNFEGVTNLGSARALARDKLMESKIVDHPSHLGFILINVGQRGGKIGWLCNIQVLKEYFNTISSFPSEMAGKNFGGPTLFVGGETSNYLPPTDLPDIRQKYFPKAELKYVPQVGHNVHAEDPATFIKIVKEFYSKN